MVLGKVTVFWSENSKIWRAKFRRIKFSSTWEEPKKSLIVTTKIQTYEYVRFLFSEPWGLQIYKFSYSKTLERLPSEVDCLVYKNLFAHLKSSFHWTDNFGNLYRWHYRLWTWFLDWTVPRTEVTVRLWKTIWERVQLRWRVVQYKFPSSSVHLEWLTPIPVK